MTIKRADTRNPIRITFIQPVVGLGGGTRVVRSILRGKHEY